MENGKCFISSKSVEWLPEVGKEYPFHAACRFLYFETFVSCWLISKWSRQDMQSNCIFVYSKTLWWLDDFVVLSHSGLNRRGCSGDWQQNVIWLLGPWTPELSQTGWLMLIHVHVLMVLRQKTDTLFCIYCSVTVLYKDEEKNLNLIYPENMCFRQ